MCSAYYLVDIVVEYSKLNLHSLTYQRTKQGRGRLYEESEIWCMAIQLVLAIRSYISCGVHPPADIQPSTVQLDASSLNGVTLRVKLLDAQFMTGHRSVYSRRQSDPTFYTTFSPQIMDDLAVGRPRTTAWYEKSAVWSIGRQMSH